MNALVPFAIIIFRGHNQTYITEYSTVELHRNCHLTKCFLLLTDDTV